MSGSERLPMGCTQARKESQGLSFSISLSDGNIHLWLILLSTAKSKWLSCVHSLCLKCVNYCFCIARGIYRLTLGDCCSFNTARFYRANSLLANDWWVVRSRRKGILTFKLKMHPSHFVLILYCPETLRKIILFSWSHWSWIQWSVLQAVLINIPQFASLQLI